MAKLVATALILLALVAQGFGLECYICVGYVDEIPQDVLGNNQNCDDPFSEEGIQTVGTEAEGVDHHYPVGKYCAKLVYSFSVGSQDYTIVGRTMTVTNDATNPHASVQEMLQKMSLLSPSVAEQLKKHSQMVPKESITEYDEVTFCQTDLCNSAVNLSLLSWTLALSIAVLGYQTFFVGH